MSDGGECFAHALKPQLSAHFAFVDGEISHALRVGIFTPPKMRLRLNQSQLRQRCTRCAAGYRTFCLGDGSGEVVSAERLQCAAAKPAGGTATFATALEMFG